MRKVLVLVIGLILLSMFAACSEDSTQTTPPPATVDDISILTETVAGGYTCSPYTMTLEATGGVAPYTWSLAAGSALPEGLALASDGKIYGLCMNVGDYTFTARVVDSSDTPQSAEREYTLPVGVQSNPSVAVYYDEAASVCSASTGSWTWLKCYISVLLEDSDVVCATACEFKLRLTNVDGIDLEPGTDYAVTNTTTPDYVAFKIGDMTLRGTGKYLLEGSAQSTMFILELGLGVVLPMVLLAFKRARNSPRLLFTVSMDSCSRNPAPESRSRDRDLTALHPRRHAANRASEIVLSQRRGATPVR